MNTQIHILLVDDHALVRDSLAHLLADEADFHLIASANNAQEALNIAMCELPDVVLMDIDMPGLNCFDATKQLLAKHPSVRVIFLSAFSHDHYIEQAIATQAKGYITKTEPMSKVLAAIRQVAAGRIYFSPDIQDRLVADKNGVRLANDENTSRRSTLSIRELQVLSYLAQGLSKKVIATTMKLSIKTVESHTEKVMSKLDIHDRVGLARFAIREGIAKA